MALLQKGPATQGILWVFATLYDKATQVTDTPKRIMVTYVRIIPGQPESLSALLIITVEVTHEGFT